MHFYMKDYLSVFIYFLYIQVLNYLLPLVIINSQSNCIATRNSFAFFAAFSELFTLLHNVENQKI